MGVIITTAYYPEPKILVKGRYNRLVTLEQIDEIRRKMIAEHGHLLKQIEITYQTKKAGICTECVCRTENEFYSILSIEKRHQHLRSLVIYCRTTKNNTVDRYYMNMNGTTEKIKGENEDEGTME